MEVDYNGKKIPLTLCEPPKIEDAINSCLIPNWLASLDKSMEVEKIEIQSIDKSPTGEVTQIKFKSKTMRGGVEIPGIVLLRGHNISLLVLFEDEVTHDKYTVLTSSPCIPIGFLMLELPLGFIDESGNLNGEMVNLIKEKCELDIKGEELIDMTMLAYGNSAPGVFMGCGLSDQYINFLLFPKVMSHDKIVEMQKNLLGNCVNDQLELKLVKFEELWNIACDSKVLTAFLLFQKLSEENKI